MATKHRDLCGLATALQDLWWDLRVLTPIMIAKREPYAMGLNREGQLYLYKWGQEVTRLIASTAHASWVNDFNDAISLVECTDADFRAAQERVWRVRPLPLSCFFLGRSCLRRILSRWQRLSPSNHGNLVSRSSDGVDLDRYLV